MRATRILLGILIGCAVIAAGIGVTNGVQQALQANTYQAAARKELSLVEPEIAQCKARLKQFHKAWQRYRTEHRGAEPPSVTGLVPRYVKSATLFSCPTAERWRRQKGVVGQGTVEIGRRVYPVTYGFTWLSSSYAIARKRHGERAPIITCVVHREVMYRSVYKKAPPLGTFDEAMRGRLAREVAETPVLAVLRNGEVRDLPPGEE